MRACVYVEEKRSGWQRKRVVGCFLFVCAACMYVCMYVEKQQVGC